MRVARQRALDSDSTSVSLVLLLEITYIDSRVTNETDAELQKDAETQVRKPADDRNSASMGKLTGWLLYPRQATGDGLWLV